MISPDQQDSDAVIARLLELPRYRVQERQRYRASVVPVLVRRQRKHSQKQAGTERKQKQRQVGPVGHRRLRVSVVPRRIYRYSPILQSGHFRRGRGNAKASLPHTGGAGQAGCAGSGPAASAAPRAATGDHRGEPGLAPARRKADKGSNHKQKVISYVPTTHETSQV